MKAKDTNTNIEILIEGKDETPKTGSIGEPIEFKENIEMWHHSGGYWKYKDAIIYDSVLGDDLFDESILRKAIGKELIFEYKLDSDTYEKLIKSKNIKVVCSTRLKDPVTGKNKPITDIFYEKPSIELKNGKLYFKGTPKLHFFNKNRIDQTKSNKCK